MNLKYLLLVLSDISGYGITVGGYFLNGITFKKYRSVSTKTCPVDETIFCSSGQRGAGRICLPLGKLRPFVELLCFGWWFVPQRFMFWNLILQHGEAQWAVNDRGDCVIAANSCESMNDVLWDSICALSHKKGLVLGRTGCYKRESLKVTLFSARWPPSVLLSAVLWASRMPALCLWAFQMPKLWIGKPLFLYKCTQCQIFLLATPKQTKTRTKL